MAQTSPQAKQRRMPKESRQNLKFWAEGAQETILKPHIEPYADALDRGWKAERDYHRAVCTEYHARISWQLQDHEEPVLPLPVYDPAAIPNNETLSPEDKKAKCARIKLLDERIRRWLKYRVKKMRQLYGNSKLDFRKNPYAILLSKLTGITAPPKARQAYQQYMVECYQTKIDPEVQKRWRESNRNDPAKAKSKPNAAFRTKVARDMFNKLPPHEQVYFSKKAKEEASNAKDKYERDMNSPPSLAPEDIQRCIDNIPNCIGPLIQGIQDHTKFKFFILYGGPTPANGGEVMAWHANFGRNLANNPVPFSSFKPDVHNAHTHARWIEFLQSAYTDEDSRVTALDPDQRQRPEDGDLLSESESESNSSIPVTDDDEVRPRKGRFQQALPSQSSKPPQMQAASSANPPATLARQRAPQPEKRVNPIPNTQLPPPTLPSQLAPLNPSNPSTRAAASSSANPPATLARQRAPQPEKRVNPTPNTQPPPPTLPSQLAPLNPSNPSTRAASCSNPLLRTPIFPTNPNTSRSRKKVQEWLGETSGSTSSTLTPVKYPGLQRAGNHRVSSHSHLADLIRKENARHVRAVSAIPQTTKDVPIPPARSRTVDPFAMDVDEDGPTQDIQESVLSASQTSRQLAFSQHPTSSTARDDDIPLPPAKRRRVTQPLSTDLTADSVATHTRDKRSDVPNGGISPLHDQSTPTTRSAVPSSTRIAVAPAIPITAAPATPITAAPTTPITAAPDTAEPATVAPAISINTAPAPAVPVISTAAAPPALPAVSVTTTTTPTGCTAISGTTSMLPLCPPSAEDWFRDAFKSVTEQDLGDEFSSIIRSFTAIEASYNYANPSKGLPRRGRPAELERWIAGGRWRVKTPVVRNPSAYSTTWWAWWASLQPPWRKFSTNVRPIIDSYGDDWNSLKFPGQNGVLSIVATLFWWGCAVSGPNSPQQGPGSFGDWSEAVRDASWMLRGLLGNMS